MSFAQKFGLALAIISAGGIIVDSQKEGSSFSKAIAGVHTPLLFLGAAMYLVNRQ
jgi:hypothetical protein